MFRISVEDEDDELYDDVDQYDDDDYEDDGESFFSKIKKAFTRRKSSDTELEDELADLESPRSMQMPAKEQTVSGPSAAGNSKTIDLSQRRAKNMARAAEGTNYQSARSAMPTEIFMSRPKAQKEATDAVNQLLDGRVLILNLDGLNVDVAQRIFDFVTGAIYSIGGNFEVIANQVYVFAPANIELNGDFLPRE